MRGHIVQTDFKTLCLQPKCEVPVCRIGARHAADAAYARLCDRPDAFCRPQAQFPQQPVDWRCVSDCLAIHVNPKRDKAAISRMSVMEVASLRRREMFIGNNENYAEGRNVWPPKVSFEREQLRYIRMGETAFMEEERG